MLFLVKACNYAHDPAYHVSFFREFPGFGQAARKGMWLHHQHGTLAVKPAATVAATNFHKVKGTGVFRIPGAIVNVVQRSIYKDDASRAQKWGHSAVQ